MKRNPPPFPFLGILLASIACIATSSAQVVISEIHYHPVEEDAFDSTTTYNPVLDLSEDVHEFVEIQNTGASAVDLSGWTLSGGADFVFPIGTSIPAGGFKVIAKNVSRLQTVYSITGVLGPYSGKLSNSGTSITLSDSSQATVDAVTYSSSFPWAQSANAFGASDRFTGLSSDSYQYKGRSLQRVSATDASSDPANWLASPLTGPTPGSAQAVTRTVPKPVVIAKSYYQTSDGATNVQPSQAVTLHCNFSSTASLSTVQLEWFVDTADSSSETHTTTTMTDLGNGEYTASIAGQPARSVIRYRIKANRGDGSEVVSPRSDDPAISAVGVSNALEAWHGYFVSATGRSSTYPNYDLFISTTNLAQIKTNAQQGGNSPTVTTRRVTAGSAAGLPRSVPWVASTAPLWDGTVPAVFAYDGVLYDVRVRFHGSRYHRYDNATNLLSFKLHFPKTQPFQEQTSWFITSHGEEYEQASRLNRLLGLPSSKTRSVYWYLNSNSVATRLEQGEFGKEMLDEYHKLRYQAQSDASKEESGDLYKDVGNREATASNLEGPYAAGDLAAIAANTSWTKYQRYEWTYSSQSNSWKGPKPFADMLEGMWAARGDTYSTHNFSSNSTQLATTKAWFTSNYDLESNLTSLALMEWIGIYDDGKQNQFYWRRSNNKWVRLGWDYDSVMATTTSQAGPGNVGYYTQTIYGGEYGAANVFDGVNWWKDTFYKCFRDEYKQRLWQLNNSFLDPTNMLALGFPTTSRAYKFAALRQAQVNTQLGLGTYYKPARPTNSTPSTGSTVLAGASLKSSAFSSPNSKSHLSTKWEIRSASGNYEEPTYSVTSTSNLTTLAIPYPTLNYGSTYYWRVTYTDADSHASIISAETSFTWGLAAAVAGDLKINEILADNKTTIANDGTYPDYIELRNNGSSAYDLTGITLTDDVSDPSKYSFPAGNTIAAGGHLIIWCDKETSAAGIHTGFALSSGGQTVLMMSGTNVLDTVTFGPQATDLSIGRITDGTGSWTATTPTPGTTNTAATLGTTATLTINEWMAAPAYGDDWFELHNSGSAPVALASLYLSDTAGTPKITQIPALSYIGAGSYTKFYANGNSTGDNNCNFSLKASGESLILTAANGTTTLDIINFSTQATDVSQGRLPDGGSTLVSFSSKTASPGNPNWAPSSVIINEVLAHAHPPLEDAVEIYNPSASPVSIGGWWLSDDRLIPQKYQIPAGTTVPAGGYVVIYEAGFSNGTVPFSFSAWGDEAVLTAVDGTGAQTGYRSLATFGPSPRDRSFGRVAATGLGPADNNVEYWASQDHSFGQDDAADTATFRTGTGMANSASEIGPVLINEIMYHPIDIAGGADNTTAEFIELHNPSNAAVDLSGWRIRGDTDFTFASGTTIPAFGYLLVTGFNPATDATSLASFRGTYSLADTIPIVGPFSTKLANSTGNLELVQPDILDDLAVNYLEDKTEYRDIAPWPTTPDGTGSSLQRLSRSMIGNTAANWSAATPTPGALNSGLYTTLDVWSQSPAPAGTVGTPYSFTLVGVGGTPAYTWSLDSGSLPGGLTLDSGILSGTPTAGGTFTFTLRLTDSLSATTTREFTITIDGGIPDSDSDGMPDAWETANGLIVGTDDSGFDADGDGQSNLAEYLAGTNPQSSVSVFAILSTSLPADGSVGLTWSGIAGKTYQIWSSPDLATWTAVEPAIPCTTTGVLSADVATGTNPNLYLRISVAQ